MNFSHCFIVATSINKVHEFHLSPHALQKLTPFPMKINFEEVPIEVTEGSVLKFTLRFLFLPIKWTARISNLSKNGFEDSQLSGPFQYWQHIHYYNQISPHHVLITDTIFASLKSDFISWLIGLIMFYSLPILFTYRKFITRKLLSESDFIR